MGLHHTGITDLQEWIIGRKVIVEVLSTVPPILRAEPLETKFSLSIDYA